MGLQPLTIGPISSPKPPTSHSLGIQAEFGLFVELGGLFVRGAEVAVFVHATGEQVVHHPPA